MKKGLHVSLTRRIAFPRSIDPHYVGPGVRAPARAAGARAVYYRAPPSFESGTEKESGR